MVIVRAPLRVSFGGGGTDLEAYYARFGGFVVSAAITRYCTVAARAAADDVSSITSADYGLRQAFPRGTVPPVEEPLALPKAAIEWFNRRHGLDLTAFDLHLRSEVPPGTGLGSSSAMACALVRALAAHLRLTLDAAETAELACWLEIERLGMPIGKQDQYASAFGGLNAIEFTPDAVRVISLGLPPARLAALSERLLLFWTGRSRNSAGILREQRASTGSDPRVTASLHRLKALAHDMVDALRAGALDDFGRLLDLGWREKKRLSGRVSNGLIDDWYEAARRAGALGGKITGAGGGGFLLLYVPPERRRAVRSRLAHLGLHELTFDFDLAGARTVGELPTEEARLAVPA